MKNHLRINQQNIFFHCSTSHLNHIFQQVATMPVSNDEPSPNNLHTNVTTGHISQDSVSSVCEAPDIHPAITEIRGLTKSYEGLPLLAALCNDVSLLPPGNKADCNCRVHRHPCHVMGEADPRRWSHAGVQSSHISVLQSGPSRPISWHYDDRDLNMIHFGDCLNNINISHTSELSHMSQHSHLSRMPCFHNPPFSQSSHAAQNRFLYKQLLQPKPPPPYRPPKMTSPSQLQVNSSLLHPDSDYNNQVYLRDGGMYKRHQLKEVLNIAPYLQHTQDSGYFSSQHQGRDTRSLCQLNEFAQIQAKLPGAESIA